MCKDHVTEGRRVILRRRKGSVVGVQRAKGDNMKRIKRERQGAVLGFGMVEMVSTWRVA